MSWPPKLNRLRALNTHRHQNGQWMNDALQKIGSAYPAVRVLRHSSGWAATDSETAESFPKRPHTVCPSVASITVVLFCAILFIASVPLSFAQDRTLLQLEDHSKHFEAQKKRSGYTRSKATYRIPDVTLLDMDATSVSLPQILNGSEAVVLQFIYTSCTTVCPVLSATLGTAQAALSALGKPFRLISISIDPDEDTPARLSEYAKRFNGGKHWLFLTGSRAETVAVEKAFNAFSSNNKMYHQPLTFIRVNPASPWLRIEGFLTSAEMVAEYKTLLGYSPPTR